MNNQNDGDELSNVQGDGASSLSEQNAADGNEYALLEWTARQIELEDALKSSKTSTKTYENEALSEFTARQSGLEEILKSLTTSSGKSSETDVVSEFTARQAELEDLLKHLHSVKPCSDGEALTEWTARQSALEEILKYIKASRNEEHNQTVRNPDETNDHNDDEREATTQPGAVRIAGIGGENNNDVEDDDFTYNTNGENRAEQGMGSPIHAENVEEAELAARYQAQARQTIRD